MVAHRCVRPCLPALLALAALVPAHAQEPGATTPVAPREPELLDNASLAERLAKIAREHPSCASVLRIGLSRAGQPIELLRLAAGEPPPGRPAILVVGNIDGPQVFSSAVALAHAEALANGFDGADEFAARAKAFLEQTTLYVLPRANPDAAASRFSAVRAEVEASGSGVDDDRDRRDGEDPPSDVDGDGVIAWMRWKDPEGAWILDPTDPRALVRADAKLGEQGEYKLSIEGRDLDHDESIAEDAAANAVVNRNFPHDWREHGVSSGRFPMDEPEARALAEFLLLRKDVALVVTYGTLDTLVEKPKSVADNAPAQKRIPQAGWLESDAALIGELSKRYGARTSNKTKGRGEESGSFQSWVYQHRGLWSLAIPLWDMPNEAKKKDAADGDATPEKDAKDKESGKGEARKPGEDAQRLTWIDSAGEAARFLPWKAFRHPELGDVEIGGFAPFARVEPPKDQWAGIARKELDFLMTLGGDLARVRVGQLVATRLGSGLIEVKAVVQNDSLLPMQSKSGQRTQTQRPLRVRLVLPDGATLVAGETRALVRDLGGKSRREMRWLVSCPNPLQIGLELDSDHAGTAQAIVEVKP